uniref:Uncharacterized protein n=1 Tax=Physcomitrium patens TaxID=3218 RepID=A0A2K1IM75_PHYPA|nr:hypothetical protein PHYPA_026703 [Physcomitrium patens]
MVTGCSFFSLKGFQQQSELTLMRPLSLVAVNYSSSAVGSLRGRRKNPCLEGLEALLSLVLADLHSSSTTRMIGSRGCTSSGRAAASSRDHRSFGRSLEGFLKLQLLTIRNSPFLFYLHW